ncbi:MAG: ComEC family competence protein [Cytophagales bacterium]|nr:MAG: ComEC family competence protein [Cytophagales bacterium]
MSSLAVYTYLKIVIVFIIGIITSRYFELSSFQNNIILSLICTHIGLYCIEAFFLKNTSFFYHTAGVQTFWIIALLGFYLAQKSIEKNDAAHFIHQNQDAITHYIANIQSEPQEKSKFVRLEVKVVAIKTNQKWIDTKGKVIVYIRKDTNKLKNEPLYQLAYGDEIIIRAKPTPTTQPTNPYAFDYARYLSLQNIYHQNFIRIDDFRYYQYAPQSYFIKYAIDARQWCDATFRRLIPDKQVYGIATAFVLGVRDAMDEEILTAYANTGLMHVLAVSGFHIIFIVQLIEWFLAGLKKRKHGIWIFTIIAIVLLWMYAYLTGLAASVLRAVLMFSVVLLGNAMHKKGNIYNTLAFSAWILLLYNPFMLYDVGFQLSYMAVLGIVYFQPFFYRSLVFYRDFYRVLDKSWQILSVSLAAQITTFPITIYYFHQFPNYFLLSNLLILPLAPSILYAGIVTLCCNAIPYVNVFCAAVLYWSIVAMNTITFQLAKLPYALTERLYLNGFEVAIIYIVIICFSLFYVYYRLRYLWLSSVLVSLFCISIMGRVYTMPNQRILGIYDVNRTGHVVLIEGQEALILTDSVSIEKKKAFTFALEGYFGYKGINENYWYTWADATAQKKHFGALQAGKNWHWLIWQKQHILFITGKIADKYFQQLIQKIKPHYIVLQNNAWLGWHLLEKNNTLKKVIFDATNRRSFLEKIKKEMQPLAIPYHIVNEQGAFLLEIKS